MGGALTRAAMLRVSGSLRNLGGAAQPRQRCREPMQARRVMGTARRGRLHHGAVLGMVILSSF